MDGATEIAATITAYFGAIGGFIVGVVKTATALENYRRARRMSEIEDEPTGKHQLPGPQHMDTVLEQHYRDTVRRLSRDLDATQAENRALRGTVRDQEAEILHLRGELEARTYSLASAQSQALTLRKEVSALRGGGDGKRPAPRTPGSEPALQPVTDPPPGALDLSHGRPFDELRDTPPSGMSGVRAPREDT